MKITFHDRKLKELANDDRKAIKALGKTNPRRYFRQVHLARNQRNRSN